MAHQVTPILTEGASVRLADRETSAADTKSGLFYPYYRGLTGTIAKLYSDSTAAVAVDPDSLPEDIRKRHQAGTDAMRQKWLDGLSDEGRNKLSAAEKKFSLRYSLLVSLADLSSIDAPEPARKSLTEIEEAEAAHLAEVTKKKAA
jgi:hypothetical protein